MFYSLAKGFPGRLQVPPWAGPVQKEKVNPELGTAVMQTEPFPVVPTTFQASAAAQPGNCFYWKNIKSKTQFFSFGNNAHLPLGILKCGESKPICYHRSWCWHQYALSATPSTVLGTLKDFLSPPEPPFSVPSATSSQQPPGKPLPSPGGKHPKAQPKHHPQTDFLLFQVKPGERSWLLLVVICKVYLTPSKQAIFMQNLLVHKRSHSAAAT